MFPQPNNRSVNYSYTPMLREGCLSQRLAGGRNTSPWSRLKKLPSTRDA
jgi:hypothetical protein